jgi:hypothetical protein
MNYNKDTIYPIFSVDGRKIQSGVMVHDYLFDRRERSTVVAVGARATVSSMNLVHVSGIAAGKLLEAVSVGETRQGGVRFMAKPRSVLGDTAVIVIRDEKQYTRFGSKSMTSENDRHGSRHYSFQIDMMIGGDVSGCVCGSVMCKAKLPLSAIERDSCPKCRRPIQPSLARNAFPGVWIKQGQVPVNRDRIVVKEGIAFIGVGQIFSLATSSPATDANTMFYRWDGKDEIKVWDASIRIEELLDETS